MEHNAESLKFYLWYVYYSRRFEALPQTDKSKSPEWKPPPPAIGPNNFRRSVATALTNITDLEDEHDRDGGGGDGHEDDIKIIFAESVDAECPPASEQPFRAEVNHVISQYLLPSSPYQLNISSRDLASSLRGLSSTTHPSAFSSIFKSVNISLRLQSHPSFISFAIRNSNTARVGMIRIFGAISLTAALSTGVLLVLSGHHRTLRLVCFVPAMFGVLAVFNSFRGLCTLLIMFGFKRNRRPWERFRDEEAAADGDSRGDDEQGGIELEERYPELLRRELLFIQSYGKAPVISRLHDVS